TSREEAEATIRSAGRRARAADKAGSRKGRSDRPSCRSNRRPDGGLSVRLRSLREHVAVQRIEHGAWLLVALVAAYGVHAERLAQARTRPTDGASAIRGRLANLHAHLRRLGMSFAKLLEEIVGHAALNLGACQEFQKLVLDRDIIFQQTAGGFDVGLSLIRRLQCLARLVALSHQAVHSALAI